jgi:hypothetical protein
MEQIKRYTDRPIQLRHKPRGRGTSGPSEAKVPLSEDLKEAWCVVTSCSIAAVEAMCEGIPVFCDNKSFAVDVGNIELADIENPYYGGPEPWLYSLAYQQFTPEEFYKRHSSGDTTGQGNTMKIEKLANGLWVPSTDAQIEQWREKGYPHMQDTCLNQFINWCKIQNKKFNLIVDVGAWCGTWSMAMQEYAKNINCYEPNKIHYRMPCKEPGTIQRSCEIVQSSS